LVTVAGSNRAGRTALFRAAAGLHSCGKGRIARPLRSKVAFLPEQSYLPQVSLRELLTPTGSAGLTDEQLRDALVEFGLGTVVKQQESFDTPRNWLDALSFREEKLMAIARASLTQPKYMFFDELDSSLDATDRQQVLGHLAAKGITCVLFGNLPDPESTGPCLELRDDGSWNWLQNPKNP
jgi:putative ATP-binding cassette transporter